MIITATELKTNIGKYLVLASNEDIVITKNGKGIAKLTNFRQEKLDILDSLIGAIPNPGITLEQARAERLSRQ